MNEVKGFLARNADWNERRGKDRKRERERNVCFMGQRIVDTVNRLVFYLLFASSNKIPGRRKRRSWFSFTRQVKECHGHVEKRRTLRDYLFFN